MDVNWFRRRIKKSDLEGKEFAWGYSPSKGHYIGYKLTLAIEYPSLKPVAFILHLGSPNDAKLFKGILEELKRRKIALNGIQSLLTRAIPATRITLWGSHDSRSFR